MPVRKGYLCLRRGLEPPLDLSPLALRLRNLRLQRGPLRRHGVFGARTRTLQLRRLKPSGHRGQRTDRVKDLLSVMSWGWSSGRGTGGQGECRTPFRCAACGAPRRHSAPSSAAARSDPAPSADTQPTAQHDILSRQDLNVLTPDSRSHLEQTTSNWIVLES